MIDGKDGFDLEYETNSRWAHISAYVLVAGLVFELVNAVIWYKGVQTLAEMSAVLLIVGGVWGEIFFGHRARIAGDKQLAQYKARAAEADARAKEAQLELEQFRRPWSLPAWHLPEYDKLLNPFPGTPYRIHSMNDHDPFLISLRLQQAFAWSKWDAAPLSGAPNRNGIELIAELDGIDIRISEERRADWWPAAKALTDVFTGQGLNATLSVIESGMPSDAIHIFIGRKT